MKLETRHPVPVYSKLSLENKILFFFLLFLAVLGLVGLSAQQWAIGWMTERMERDRLEVAFEELFDPLSREVERAAASGDPALLSRLVSDAAGTDRGIAYLSVEDAGGRELAFAASPRGTALGIESRPMAKPAIEGDEARRNTVLETTFPLDSGRRRVGALRAGTFIPDGPATLGTVMVIGIMAVAALLVLLLARAVIRRAVRPLKKLTQLADQISTGNLDPLIDFGVHVNCWEIKNCQRTDCKAYMNFDQQCWYIDGTPCEGYEPRFPEKLQGCRRCEVYQAHRGDEIVQLADSFKHMTNVLKESREELVKSSDFQRRLIRNSFNGIVATDPSNTITIFNRAAVELLGAPSEEVIGKSDWREFFSDDLEKRMDLPLSHERVRRIRGFPPRESMIRRRDGEWVDVLLSGISLFERGILIGKVFFFQDLREIKRLREDLIRSERLAATGQAAAGISHSIRNIHDGLVGGTYVFKAGRRRGDEEKMEKGWDMIERNTQIISDLVNDLLNFAKERRPDYAPVEPGVLIGETLASLGLAEDGRVRVEIDVDDAAGPVSLDAHAFQQCLANLIRNATEAVPEDRSGLVRVAYRTEGERAIFTVSDDGMGMSPEVIDKVKGGMFSTKGSKGTGLGLLVVQKIVGEHRGTLSIESKVGRGSTFRIEIPAEGGPAADRGPRREPWDSEDQPVEPPHEQVRSNTNR